MTAIRVLVGSLLLLGLVSISLASTASAQTATPSTCTVPPQGVVVTIDLPNPGAEMPPGGNVVVQGVAFDTAATDGPGVDRVSVFLGDRDAGGIFWGDAQLGLASPQLGATRATAGYSRRSPTIPTTRGGNTIFVYARSSLTGREAVASIPVFIGPPPSGQAPTAVPTPLPLCTPAPAATATPTSTATPLPPTATPVPPTATPLAAAPPPPPAAPPAAAATVAPPETAPPSAVAPATTTQTTAPRGGGIPVELGLLLLSAGGSVVGAGLFLRRRERRGAPPRT